MTKEEAIAYALEKMRENDMTYDETSARIKAETMSEKEERLW